MDVMKAISKVIEIVTTGNRTYAFSLKLRMGSIPLYCGLGGNSHGAGSSPKVNT